jgi:hypothetical protein
LKTFSKNISRIFPKNESSNGALVVPISLFAPNKYINVYNWLICDHIFGWMFYDCTLHKNKITFINEICHTILMDKIDHTNAIDHLDEIINMDDHSQNTWNWTLQMKLTIKIKVNISNHEVK